MMAIDRIVKMTHRKIPSNKLFHDESKGTSEAKHSKAIAYIKNETSPRAPFDIFVIYFIF